MARALRDALDALEGVALDADALAYACAGGEEAETVDDFVDFIYPVLAEKMNDDETAAKALALEVWTTIGGRERTATGPVDGVRAARAPVRLGEGWVDAAAAAAAADGTDGAVDGTVSDVKATTRDVKEREKVRRRAERLAADAVEARGRLGEELRDARRRAAEARCAGASKALANVELGPFNLPNPGGGADLIDDASLTLTPGRRYGLIGRNGSGKSTLLRHLAARRVEGIDASYSVHYVTQEVELTEEEEEMTPDAVVLRADVQRLILLEEQARLETSEDASALTRLREVSAMLDSISASSAPARVAVLLKNLGFTDALVARPMRALSGGWRVRTALAAALFAQPDILFLDEPTNHLSIAAVMFLSRELSTNPVWSSRIIVTVSHDRHFLDEVTTDSLHISGVAKRLTAHRMAYSAWAKKRREQQLAMGRKMELRREKIASLQSFANHGFKYGGSSSAIGAMKKRSKEAQKLEEEAEEESEAMADLEEDAELALNLQAGGELQHNIVRFDEVSFAYPGGETLFADVDLSIDSKSRVVLLGENGQGKTTMVKIITGDLEPTKGVVTRDRRARVCLVNQHHAEQLDYEMTPLAFMLDRFPGDGSYDHQQKIRSHLSESGVPTELQNVPALALSGGQKSRVAMAAVSYKQPHLIILDEPTNNLDLESCEALAEAIQKFEGGVVLVSHDQYFVEKVGKEVIVIERGTVKRLDSFAAYKRSIAKKLAAATN